MTVASSFCSWIIILCQYIYVFIQSIFHVVHYLTTLLYLSLERVFLFWKFTAKMMEVMQSLPLTIEAIKMVSRFWKSAEKFKNYEILKISLPTNIQVIWEVK